MFFYYFLIDFIPLVQTVSLHLLLLTAQQEHFEFDADEFTMNTIMESSIKLSFSKVSSIYYPFFLHYSLGALATLQFIKSMFNFTRIHRNYQRILFHGYHLPSCLPNPRYTKGADSDQH